VLPHRPVYAAARYALLSGGKRLRPRLLLLTVEALGGDVEAAILPAVALEMIHTYSLVHDDLPCMDDDDVRRGKPTVHRLYGEAAAVLAGDLLLTHAFLLIADQSELVRIFANAAGGEGLIGGQSLDLQGSQDIEHLYSLKTASLFRCALHAGALLAKTEHTQPFIEFGEAFGCLFQAVDDLIDHEVHADIAHAMRLWEHAQHKLKALPGALDKIEALLEEFAPCHFA